MQVRTLAVFAGILATGTAAADTLVCRSGKIVQPGMHPDEVIAKCGEPTSKSVTFEDTRAVNAAGASYKTGQTKVETWRYDRGTRKSAAVLIIRNGKVVSIDFE